MQKNLTPWGVPLTKHDIIAGPVSFHAAQGRYILGPGRATKAEAMRDIRDDMPPETAPHFLSWLVQAQWEYDTGREG
jgi:hypothetical protein